MMQFMRILCGLLFAALMTACGGGGGSAGAVAGVTPPKPTVTVDIITAAGVLTSTVGGNTTTFARALVRDSAGSPVAGAVVTFKANEGLAVFSPSTGTALSDANGIAKVQILSATGSAGGAGVVTADATVGSVAATQGAYSFQVPTGVPDTPTARVADFVLLLDKTTLSNGGTTTAKLTVVTVDSSNNIVAGAAVTVATDARSIFTPGSSVTDSAGQYTGQISAGNDKTDRTVGITVTVNGIVKQTTLQVAGSQIAITVTPTIPSPATAATVTARVTDGASAPIANATVTFSGDIPQLVNRQVATDVNGRAIVGFLAPGAAGSYIVKASASGVSSQMSVQVGSSSSIPVAVIPSGALPALSAIPNVLATNVAGSTANQAQLKFLFLNSSNVPIPNVRVRFEIVSTGLGSFDSTISTGTTTVYTNASGAATASLISGSTDSPTDGVQVRACYKASDFTSTSECPASVLVNLTIAKQALAVSIGNDNLLEPGSGTYIKRFVVTVADAAGRAVPDAAVDISLDITHYGKGLFSQAISFPMNIADYATYVPDATTTPTAFAARVSCINEDLNRNGFVDPGENINASVDSFGQATLEPRRSDIILSYAVPTVRTTNADGILEIKVEYSQRFATWLSYRIRATTNVSGSQGSAERAFITTFIEGDLLTGSFNAPPYGSDSCSSPN